MSLPWDNPPPYAESKSLCRELKAVPEPPRPKLKGVFPHGKRPANAKLAPGAPPPPPEAEAR